MSPPSQLTSLRTFDIAVKESSHPPAHWVHTQVLIWLQEQLCTTVIACKHGSDESTETLRKIVLL